MQQENILHQAVVICSFGWKSQVDCQISCGFPSPLFHSLVFIELASQEKREIDAKLMEQA